MIRVFQKKREFDGRVFDSKEEVIYYRLLKEDRLVTGQIHTQVRFNVIKPIWMMIPKQLKTKVRYDKRLLIGGHNYTADFVYLEGDDKLVICDVKSPYTETLREFSITKKAFIAKVLEHDKKCDGNKRKVVFRVAVYKKGSFVIKDYPPDNGFVIL